MHEQIAACTLSQADLERVAARYAEAGALYEGSIRFEGAVAHVTLRGDKSQIAALLDAMIARERACCPFLTFDPQETDEGYELRLGVDGAPGLEPALPREAVETLFPDAARVG